MDKDIVIGIVGLLIIFTIIVAYFATKKNTSTQGAENQPGNNQNQNQPAKSSNPTTRTTVPQISGTTILGSIYFPVYDTGDVSRTSGWYDMQNTGKKNNYCRWVGDAPKDYFACAYPGNKDQYIKPPGGNASSSKPHENLPLNASITDLGWPDWPRGLYDLDNNNKYDYFCRWVGDKNSKVFACANNNTLKDYRNQFDIKPTINSNGLHIPY